MVQAVIYARVSTNDQNCERQIVELTAFAERCGYEVVQVFQEKASGAKNDREQRANVLQLARQRKIDVILVSELSRWGRSTEDLLSTLKDLTANNVSLKALSGIDFDLSTAQGKLMVTMLAGFSEFERALTMERVKSGVALARRKGVKFGRPVFDRQERVERLLSEGKTVRDIAKELKISKTTVMKVKQGGFAK